MEQSQEGLDGSVGMDAQVEKARFATTATANISATPNVAHIRADVWALVKTVHDPKGRINNLSDMPANYQAAMQHQRRPRNNKLDALRQLVGRSPSGRSINTRKHFIKTCLPEHIPTIRNRDVTFGPPCPIALRGPYPKNGTPPHSQETKGDWATLWVTQSIYIELRDVLSIPQAIEFLVSEGVDHIGDIELGFVDEDIVLRSLSDAAYQKALTMLGDFEERLQSTQAAHGVESRLVNYSQAPAPRLSTHLPSDSDLYVSPAASGAISRLPLSLSASISAEWEVSYSRCPPLQERTGDHIFTDNVEPNGDTPESDEGRSHLFMPPPSEIGLHDDQTDEEERKKREEKADQARTGRASNRTHRQPRSPFHKSSCGINKSSASPLEAIGITKRPVSQHRTTSTYARSHGIKPGPRREHRASPLNGASSPLGASHIFSPIPTVSPEVVEANKKNSNRVVSIEGETTEFDMDAGTADFIPFDDAVEMGLYDGDTKHKYPWESKKQREKVITSCDNES